MFFDSLNPFKSTRSYGTGMDVATKAGEATTYYYEEGGLKTTFTSPAQLRAFVAQQDAEERTPKLLRAVAVLLIVAGIWLAYKKK